MEGPMTQEGGVQPSPSIIQFCTNCGASVDDKSRFCSNCGVPTGQQPLAGPPLPAGQYYPPYYYQPQPRSSFETFKEFGRGIASIGLILLALDLILNVVIMFWGISIVLPIALDPTQGTSLFLIIPWTNPLLTIVDLTGVAFGAYYVVLIIVIATSFAWLIWKSRAAFKDEISFRQLKSGHSPLYIMGTLFFAVLAFDTVYAIFLSLIGVQVISPNFPSMELWQLLQGLAAASVWEELIVRVLYIGVPLLVIDLITKKMKDPKRYLLGGNFKLGAKEIALLCISSGLFAYGHIVSWDAWKIIPAGIAGLAFGYLFLRVGLYASIVLHFSFDYLSMPLDLTSSTLVVVTFGLIILFWELLGGVYLAVNVRRMILFLAGADKKPKPQAVAYPPMQRQVFTPPGYQGQPPGPQPPSQPQTTTPFGTAPRSPYSRNQPGQGFFSCMYCGWTEARYRDGQLECARCGKRN
jgi:hypothetical protein